MKILACMSLAGGQGKTTTATLLGKHLAAAGHTVLLVDGDPQSNLTTFLGHEVGESEPTLLEVMKATVEVEDAIYATSVDNLFLIPSDDGLDHVQDYLSSTGVGAMVMGKRLAAVKDTFSICLIDSPPQRSQMCKSIIGAADHILVPCESTVKGYGSLVRTLEAVNELKDIGASTAELLGVIPFRDRWVGANQTQESRSVIEQMREEVGEALVLPSIRESEKFKKAISQQSTLAELGVPGLAYPFDVLVERIAPKEAVPA